jgi:hypothetical protein
MTGLPSQDLQSQDLQSRGKPRRPVTAPSRSYVMLPGMKHRIEI